MQRVVIDTNIYIDWLNASRHEAVIFQREAVKYMSAIVLMELLAGAFSAADRKLIQGVASTFTRAGRILVPAVSVYEEGGRCCAGSSAHKVTLWPALTVS